MLRSTFLSIILIATATACSSSSSPGGSGGQGGSVEADIDGTHFDAILVVGAPVGGTFGVSALEANHVTLALVIDMTTTGTYLIEPGSRNELLFSDDTGQYLATGDRGSGTITVTTYTAREVKGTFSGMLVDSSGDTVRVVTNGTFDSDL